MRGGNQQIWKRFCEAYTRMLQTEFYEQEYPEFAKQVAELGSDVVSTRAVQDAIKSGLNPTDCINDLLTVALEGSRYSMEALDDFVEQFKMLINAGGVFPFKRLEEGEEETEDIRNALMSALKTD